MSAATPPVAACFHGFLRTGASMWWLARALRRAGYADVVLPTFGYHRGTLDLHAAAASRALASLAARFPGAPIDLVTHSFGGVLARATLAREDAPPVRRLVMLSPPNQGADRAAQVRRLLPVHHAGWDPLGQILPGVPARQVGPPLAIPATEIGILTGGRSGQRGFSPFLDDDNDGTVRVEEARLDGASDFLVVPVRHPMMPLSPLARSQVLAFLATGRFTR